MIFYIYGTDNYRVSEKLKELKTSFIQKRDKAGLNIVNISGDTITLAQIEQESLTTPFLGDKKMIVIHNILKNKKISKETTAFLTNNKDRIDNIIVFVDTVDPNKAKLDRKNKLIITGELFKFLSTREYVWEFNNLKGHDLSTWIKKYANNKRIQINSDAVDELIMRSGNELFAITSEIAKLSAYKRDKIIIAQDIKTLVNNQFDDNIFDLVDSMGNRNKKLALKLIADQLNFGSHPLLIISMISRQFKIILKTKDSEASAKDLKIHPFVFSKAQKQGNNFDIKQLINIINDILNIEKKLKSGEPNPELILNLFITKNC
jgi:DNA polymerase-3 subunit delta